jgi:hypothetical protein
MEGAYPPPDTVVLVTIAGVYGCAIGTMLVGMTCMVLFGTLSVWTTIARALK